MNKSRENVLLSFWLPFRKSNFINSIDDATKDNLVNKIINFAFYYQLDVTKFDINLNDTEYNSIFKLQETKITRLQREHVKKHLSMDKDIRLTGDIRAHDTLTEYKYKLTKKEEDIEVNFAKSETNHINHLCLKFKFTKESQKIFNKFNFFQDDRKKFTSTLLKSLEFKLLLMSMDSILLM